MASVSWCVGVVGNVRKEQKGRVIADDSRLEWQGRGIFVKGSPLWRGWCGIGVAGEVTR